ncbi:hypothetical protein TL16_g12346 [Triparma laevis f. inornata]|uniref:GRAM domain-containing protein n=2 Tax=Triparma laevis TaxID=1534972 RepID=A0A9W7E2C6_9STRA|nr:hypothetical protein TrLO_g15163 [Triparma laevis f. longispina]GMH92428.1 hypothetical protein TL16_g12346 [Triparma laevis f. inornata]
MALNTPLQKTTDPTTNAVSISPHPYKDEKFLLSRPQTTLTVTSSPHKYKATGTIYLTTYRLAFVESGISKGAPPLIHNATNAEWASVDLPLFGLFGSNFNQPILGENSLKGKCYVVPENSGFPLTGPNPNPDISWRLTFNSGTCGSFLGAFFKVMDWVNRRKVEMKSEESNSQNDEDQQNQTKTLLKNIKPSMAKDIKDAFIDPNDPSAIYL